jgi:PAS domain S-box-containing protein
MQNNLILQDNLQKLFDKGSFVLFRWNNDELWSIEYVSQNVSNLLGYSSEEFLEGKITYAECIHPDFLDQVQKEVAAESKNQSDFFEHKPYKIITNTQQEKWVLDQTLIEKDAQGNITGFVGYINDITSTMELKDENELLQQRVQLAVESTNDGIWDWDLINDEVYFSVQWKKMLGYSDKEIENKAESFFELIHPDEKENTQKTLEQHLQKRTPYVVELRLLCKDGSYKWILSRGKAIFDAQGKPIRILGSHVDISHQKEIERKLQESEFRWKFAIEGSGDGLWDWNLETDEVFFSTQWKKMLGFEEDEIKGSLKEWQKRVHPDHLQTVYKDIQNYLDGKTQKYANEHQVLCKDGSYKWILDRGIIVTRTQDGTPTRMIGTHTDVNTHRKLLIKLQDAQKTVLHEKNFVETIIESANAVVAIIDSEGRMIKLNRYGQNFTGYTEEEISQEPYKWSCLLPQNIREKVLSIIENAKKGNIVKSYQNKWISKSG